MAKTANEGIIAQLMSNITPKPERKRVFFDGIEDHDSPLLRCEKMRK